MTLSSGERLLMKSSVFVHLRKIFLFVVVNIQIPRAKSTEVHAQQTLLCMLIISG